MGTLPGCRYETGMITVAIEIAIIDKRHLLNQLPELDSRAERITA
jgi:hypothetical protein